MFSIKVRNSSYNIHRSHKHLKAEGILGTWFGDGAQDFNVHGAFNAKDSRDFKELLDGAMIQDVSSRKHDRGNDRQHRPGIELTFACPKNISMKLDGLIHKVCNKKLEEASSTAVQTILRYIEDRGMVHSKEDNYKYSTLPTHNLVFTLFNDNLHRPVGSHVHIHCILLNASKCSDGINREIVWDSLLHNIQYLGKMYQVELDIELKKLETNLSRSREKVMHHCIPAF